MVDSLTVAANRDKVSVLVGAEHQVLGVEEPHVVGIARAAVIRRRTNTTVKHHIRSHASAEILQRGKASTSHARTGVRDALDSLQRLQVELVVVVVGNDEVRLVGTANQLNRNRIHVTLDVAAGHSARAVASRREGNRTPEGPRCAVDAAVGAGGRAIRHSGSKTREVLTRVAGAVTVQVTADTVRQLRLGNLHTTVEQVDDGFLTRVLNHLQTRDGHSRRILRDAELRRRDGRVLTDIQHLVTRIGIRVVGGGVVVHDFLQNHITARECFDIPALFQSTKQRIVVRDIIREFTATALNVSGDDIADTGIGISHFNTPISVNYNRELDSSNASSSIARRLCALGAVLIPGVEPLTLTAAARAAFAARSFTCA